MSLESLANELLFDLFEYLSNVDLFHSFNGLNSRFDSLLIQYYQNKKSFDFRLILKEDLNLLRRRYLLLIINEIKSIHLSDDDTNPHEIDLFLSRLFPLNRFINLKSITLSNIYSIQKMIRILTDLQQIPDLTHLNLNQCHLLYDPTNVVTMMDQIWSLSKLTHCYLDISFQYNCYLITPTIISCSIEYLSIQGFQCGLDTLEHLYEHTPCLQDLSINLSESVDEHQQLSVISSLTTFRFKCETSSRLITSVLRKMPNLTNLAVETKIISMNGGVWQEIISKYLPKLKEFHLKMEFNLVDYDSMEVGVERLVDTYKTSFWTDQHKWFIRCYWNSEDDDRKIYLHTLPYQFKHFSINVNDNDDFMSISTCSQDSDYLLYNSVRNLDYCYTISQEMILSRMEFQNIRYLTLTLPYNEHFQSIVPRLDNLISLQIKMITWCQNENNLCQLLQSLLDQAPQLYYLKFHSWSSIFSTGEQKNKKNANKGISKMPPFTSRSSSVRYLDLRGFTNTGECQYYNDQQCLSFIRSPLGIQCEYLLIEVEKRTNIIDLVTKMTNLRSLNVRCHDRRKNDDELIKWLKNYLPSTCSFAKDSKFPNDIRLWIR